MKRNCCRGVRANRRRLYRQMKIVVVFAGQPLRPPVESVEFKREPFRLGFRGWLTNPFFQQHAEILLPNLKIENRNPVCPQLSKGTDGGSYKAFTVTGPFTVDSRITGAPSPYSMRRLSLSSNVLRALAQTLALHVIGLWPRDSKTKLVLRSPW